MTRASPARALLLLFVFSLGVMQPPIPIAGMAAVPSDLIYLALVAALAMELATRRTSLAWHPGYWPLALYMAAMIASAVGSQQPAQSAIKLATQAYLLSLPVIVCALVRTADDLRRVARWWLGGTALVAAAAIVGLVAFAVDPGGAVYQALGFYHGTLPAGDYPRLRLTFLNGNLAANYLVVSFVILLAARHLGWIERTPARLLGAGIVIAIATTISPGIGGLLLAAGSWAWLALREPRPALARWSLLAGIGGAILFVVAAAVTPIPHPAARFQIVIPALDLVLAPSARLIIWIEAVNNVALHPWFGHGIGVDAVNVRYVTPSGDLQILTDAHNMFLNLGVQCGLVGVAAILLLIAYAARSAAPWSFQPDRRNIIRLALGLAFLNGLAYQGLTGSFEDSRHLWLLFGLFLASGPIERAAREA